MSADNGSPRTDFSLMLACAVLVAAPLLINSLLAMAWSIDLVALMNVVVDGVFEVANSTLEMAGLASDLFSTIATETVAPVANAALLIAATLAATALLVQLTTAQSSSGPYGR